MNTKLERIIFGLILAPVAPLAGLMAGWWLSYAFLPEKWIPWGTLAGFGLGLLADLVWLKELIGRARRLKAVFWVAVFLFYSFGIFGFFMGVPVFHPLLAVPAGFVGAVRLTETRSEPARIKRAARQTAWFTSGVLLMVCAASAIVALVSSSTTSDLKGMLGLGFEVTQGMILGLILVGGVGLLAVNWVLAWVSTRLAYRYFRLEGWKAVEAG